jgi:hypothetical protein
MQNKTFLFVTFFSASAAVFAGGCISKGIYNEPPLQRRWLLFEDKDVQPLLDLKNPSNAEITHRCKALETEYYKEIVLAETSITIEKFQTLLQQFGDSLQLLDLTNTHITDEYLPYIGLYCPHLIGLMLSENEITDEGLKTLITVKTLKYLHLNQCQQITNKGLTYLADIPMLEELSLTQCDRVKIATIARSALEKYRKQLKKLNLSGCENITEEDLDYLAKAPLLEFLDLKDCPQITNNHGQNT